MSKHTPGPWIRSGHFIFGPKHAESRHPNGRVLVAKVVEGSHRADPQLDGGADRFGFDSEANASLIAGAAELLEACQASLLQVESYIEDAGGRQSVEEGTILSEMIDLCDQLTAAITKATNGCRTDTGKGGQQ